jgi:hypothetical protein
MPNDSRGLSPPYSPLPPSRTSSRSASTLTPSPTSTTPPSERAVPGRSGQGTVVDMWLAVGVAGGGLGSRAGSALKFVLVQIDGPAESIRPTKTTLTALTN